MQTRRSPMSILGVFALVSLLAAGAALAREPFTETFDKTFPLAAGGRVALENVNGSVVIDVWERAEVRVHAVKSASSEDLLSRLKVAVDARPNEVRIETDYPERESRGFFSHGSHDQMEVEYTLTVPRSAVLSEIDLVNGSLEITGVQGGTKAETVNGAITARGLAGEIDISTVNGAIDVEIDALTAADRVQLESVNGHVELYLAPSVGADIAAETVNGRIRTDLGLDVRKHKYVGSDMKGSIGGGGARIELSTVNGGITVNGKQAAEAK